MQAALERNREGKMCAKRKAGLSSFKRLGLARSLRWLSVKFKKVAHIFVETVVRKGIRINGRYLRIDFVGSILGQNQPSCCFGDDLGLGIGEGVDNRSKITQLGIFGAVVGATDIVHTVLEEIMTQLGIGVQIEYLLKSNIEARELDRIGDLGHGLEEISSSDGGGEKCGHRGGDELEMTQERRRNRRWGGHAQERMEEEVNSARLGIVPNVVEIVLGSVVVYRRVGGAWRSGIQTQLGCDIHAGIFTTCVRRRMVRVALGLPRIRLEGTLENRSIRTTQELEKLADSGAVEVRSVGSARDRHKDEERNCGGKSARRARGNGGSESETQGHKERHSARNASNGKSTALAVGSTEEEKGGPLWDRGCAGGGVVRGEDRSPDTNKQTNKHDESERIAYGHAGTAAEKI
ncbi:hypothetical protein DFH09DRAFT_1280776 [Mycena vulgaris]|nr:hypothetical protein DFH09DRAFT_1280776 [Mycena vulgaris]